MGLSHAVSWLCPSSKIKWKKYTNICYEILLQIYSFSTSLSCLFKEKHNIFIKDITTIIKHMVTFREEINVSNVKFNPITKYLQPTPTLQPTPLYRNITQPQLM